MASAIYSPPQPEAWDDDPDLILPSTPLHLHLSSSMSSSTSARGSVASDDANNSDTESDPEFDALLINKPDSQSSRPENLDDFDPEHTLSITDRSKHRLSPERSRRGGGTTSGTGSSSPSDDDRSSNLFSGPGSGDDYGSSGGRKGRHEDFVRREIDDIGAFSGAKMGGFGVGPGLGKADLSGSADGESETNAETIRGGTLKGTANTSQTTTVKGSSLRSGLGLMGDGGDTENMTMTLDGGIIGEVNKLGSKHRDGMGDWDEDVDLPETLTTSDLHRSLRRPASFASHISDDPSEDDRLMPSSSHPHGSAYAISNASSSSSPVRSRVYGSAFPYGRAPRSSGGPSEWDGDEDDAGFEDAFDLPSNMSRVSLSPVLSRQRSKAELDRDEKDKSSRDRERHSSATASLTDEDRTVSTDDDAFFEDLVLPPFFGGDKPPIDPSSATGRAVAKSPVGDLPSVDLQQLLREKQNARAGSAGNATDVNLGLANFAQQQQKEEAIRRSDSPLSMVAGTGRRTMNASEDMEAGLVLGDGEPLGKERLNRVRKASRSATEASSRSRNGSGAANRTHSGSVGSTGSAATVVPGAVAAAKGSTQSGLGISAAMTVEQQKQQRARGMSRVMAGLRPSSSSNNLAAAAASSGAASPVPTNRAMSASWQNVPSPQPSASTSTSLGPLLSPTQTRTLKSKKSAQLLSPSSGSISAFGSGVVHGPGSAVGGGRPALLKKSSMSSLTDAMGRSTTPIGVSSGSGFAAPTVASSARARLDFDHHPHSRLQVPDSPVIPPARPSTPLYPGAAQRYTVPTRSSAAKSQAARTTVSTSSAGRAMPSPSVERSGATSPTKLRSAMHRNVSSSGSVASFAPPPPTLIKKAKGVRYHSAGDELIEFDDLPTNMEKETRYVVRPVDSRQSSTSGKTPTPNALASATSRRPRPEKSTTPGGFMAATNAAAMDRERERAKEAKERSERMGRRRAGSDAKRGVQGRKEGSADSRKPAKKPHLIKNIGVAAVKVQGEMIFNPVLGSWEGNEVVLQDFDNILATSTRPALITQLSGPSPSRPGFPAHGSNGGIKVVGGMVFDPVRMSWFARDESAEDELEFGAEFADDEADFSAPTTGRQSMGDDYHWSGSEHTSTRLRNQGSSLSMGSEHSLGEDDSALNGSGMASPAVGQDSLLQVCEEAEKRHKEDYRGWTGRRQGSRSQSALGGRGRPGEGDDEDRSWLWSIRTIVME